MRICLAALAALARGDLLRGAEKPAPAVKKELAKLQGVWEYDLGLILHENGRQVVIMPADRQKRVQIRGNTFQFRQDEKQPWKWEATITLDPSANPRRLQLTRKVKEGGKEKAVVEQAIYRFSSDGRLLFIHFGLPGKPAPKQFLELNKPMKGVDGKAWILVRPKGS
jgi:uncharacterized protein (TIGR03067 family)